MKINGIEKNYLIKTLRDVADFASKNHCVHEDTYRGGTIWEICSHCGMKWADDEGGKPFDVHDTPKVLDNAYNLISKLESSKKPHDP